jgi:hypothetical protein
VRVCPGFPKKETLQSNLHLADFLIPDHFNSRIVNIYKHISAKLV